MKKLSVIIVSYNVQHFLNLCLQSVFQAVQNIDAEVIVVDNHSSDASCEMVKNKYPEVLLIENKVNLGFSKANNQGVTNANGEYVLILNPDTVLPEDSLEKMMSFVKGKENLGAIGVKLIDGTGNFLPESKRNIPTPFRALHKLVSNSNKKLGYYANQIGENDIAEVDILVGAFMCIKKEVYQKIGGFDERYFMYGEDIDLSYQLIQLGYKNYYLGNSSAIHYKGESTQKDIKYLKYFYGAMKLFYRKHFKINKIYDFIMSIGIRVWFAAKYLKLLFLREKGTNISRLLYVGSDENSFEKIKKIYPTCQLFIFPVCATRTVSRFDDLEQMLKLIEEHKIEEVIFDSEVVSFSKIIFFITELHKKAITFKIKPINADFIIGSNCSVGKGIVEKL